MPRSPRGEGQGDMSLGNRGDGLISQTGKGGTIKPQEDPGEVIHETNPIGGAAKREGKQSQPFVKPDYNFKPSTEQKGEAPNTPLPAY